jgi:hypothetical protein
MHRLLCVVGMNFNDGQGISFADQIIVKLRLPNTGRSIAELSQGSSCGRNVK